MCAGLLWDHCADRTTLRVFYGEEDPGRAARATVLDLGSASRERFSRSAAERDAAVQHASGL